MRSVSERNASVDGEELAVTIVDERDWFVPGFDLEGRRLPSNVREDLRTALLASSADTDEEIRDFVRVWLENHWLVLLTPQSAA